MFFIVNKTKRNITLGDLGLNLGPKQAIDLDKTNIPRSKSEASRSLKMAQKSGDIEVRFKDKPKSKSVFIEATPELGNIKEEIIGEMKDVMKEFLSNQTGVSKADLQELINAMPKTTETVIYRQDQENIKQREDEEIEMDEEMLAKINARTVNNIVKDTEIKAVHHEEKYEDSTILDNVGELEDLLG
jgi:hypothetical protein